MMDPSLPFIDLHRHLDGNMRISTILDLGRQHGIELPGDTEEALRPHVQVMEPEPDLIAFLKKFEWMVAVLADPAACRRIARENVEDAKREGIHYLELRASPAFMASAHQLDVAAVVEAIVEGVEEGSRATGVKAKFIGILSRHLGIEACMAELEALLTQRDRITALDLAGDEANWPAELFVEHFKRGRDAGWEITVHAGEAGGAPSIWSALRDLGATRIGHGVRAIDDPELMDHLAENRIGIEANLTSNVQTNSVPSLEEHPLRKFLEHGLLATINSDDPSISGIDLPHEYQVAAPAAGLTPEQIVQAQGNALDIAYLTPEEKAEVRAAVK